jgi:hypothetical protein
MHNVFLPPLKKIIFLFITLPDTLLFYMDLVMVEKVSEALRLVVRAVLLKQAFACSSSVCRGSFSFVVKVRCILSGLTFGVWAVEMWTWRLAAFVHHVANEFLALSYFFSVEFKSIFFNEANNATHEVSVSDCFTN